MVERELEPYQREGGPRILIEGRDASPASAMHLDPRHDPARARHQRRESRRAVGARGSARRRLADGARQPPAAHLGGARRRCRAEDLIFLYHP